MDANASCQLKLYDLTSFATSYRPSRDLKPVQKVSWATAHRMWGHPGRKTMTKLLGSVVGLEIVGESGEELCNTCVQLKLTKIISRRPQDDLVEKPFYRIGIDLIQLLPHGQSCLSDDKYAVVAKEVCRYLLSTKYMALQADANAFPVSEYIRDSEDLYEYPYYFGASNAVFADEKDTRRSSQGYVFNLFGMAIDQKATVQRTVTKLTTEAELLSLSLASSEMMEWA